MVFGAEAEREHIGERPRRLNDVAVWIVGVRGGGGAGLGDVADDVAVVVVARDVELAVDADRLALLVVCVPPPLRECRRRLSYLVPRFHWSVSVSLAKTGMGMMALPDCVPVWDTFPTGTEILYQILVFRSIISRNSAEAGRRLCIVSGACLFSVEAIIEEISQMHHHLNGMPVVKETWWNNNANAKTTSGSKKRREQTLNAFQ